MKSNQQRKMTFLSQAFEAGRKAFEYEKTGHFNKANVVFAKAANSMNWAIALEFNQQKRNLLLKIYERFSTTLNAPSPYGISPPSNLSYHPPPHPPPSTNNPSGYFGTQKMQTSQRQNKPPMKDEQNYPLPPPPPKTDMFSSSDTFGNSNGVNSGFTLPNYSYQPETKSDKDNFLNDDSSTGGFFGDTENRNMNFHEEEEEEEDEEDEDDNYDYMDDLSNNNKRRSSSKGQSGKKREMVLDIERLVMARPDTRWKDVIGLEVAIQSLKDAVILPEKYPEWFQGNRTPWRAILLFGPPGTGKTLLARALAGESDSTFLCVTAADLLSKWFGQSEKAVQELFRVAKEKTPCVLFIDEIDSFMGERNDGDSTVISRRITNEFLTQMQGLKDESKGVLVLGTTNLPWRIDSAVRRRFQKRVYIPLPDKNARNRVFVNNINKTPHELTEQDFVEFAEGTEGYSCSDIVQVVQNALMKPIHRIQKAEYFRKIEVSVGNKIIQKWEMVDSPVNENGVTKIRFHEIPVDRIKTPLVTRNDLLQSIRECRPSIQQEELEKYEMFKKQFGN